MVRRATTDLEVSVSPVHAIKTLRLLAEEAGWSMERHEGSRLVDRFAIIMPMAQSTRTLGIRLLDGPLRGLEMTAWSETRGSAGALNITSWVMPGGMEHELNLTLLQHWVARVPRCPWHWTFSERSKVGYMLPVWRKARKKFRDLGFDVKKKAWPKEPDLSWPQS